jgi:hypothetical protein
MQLALGALGAGVGSFFGYASIGWSIGSAIGNYLFPSGGQDVEGPRMTDRTVSGSTYGNYIPRIYGTYRVSGEIIDSKATYDEQAHKEEAGKGGGGGSYTTYTYFATFAVALCDHEIFGIRRIWFDGKLVYTLSDTADLAQIAKSGEFALRSMELYTGTETQQPSPTLEAIHGAGNVPAYRGVSYLVFNRLDITKFGRIPQITVEVIREGSLAGSQAVFCRETVSAGTGTHIGVNNGTMWFHCNEYGTGAGRSAEVFKTFRLKDGTLVNKKNNLYGFGNLMGFSNSGNFAAFNGVYSSGLGIGFGFQGGDIITPVCQLSFPNGFSMAADSGVFSPSDKLKFYGDKYLWVLSVNTAKLFRFDLPSVEQTALVGFPAALWPAVTISWTDYGTFNLPPPCFCIDQDSGDVFVTTGDPTSHYGEWSRYTAEGDLIETKTGIPQAVYCAFDDGKLWMNENDGAATDVITVWDWSTETLIANCGAIAPRDPDAIGGGTSDNYNRQLVASGNVCFLSQARIVDKFQLVLTPSVMPLDEVVSDICTSVGIEPSEIDVTDLASDDVRGYMVSRQTAARGALEQLSVCFFFDGRESDGVLEFIKRGNAVQATLDDSDLGCYEGDNVVELVDAERIQEEELPRALTFNYADINLDYQPGAQYASRQSVLNGTETTMSIPIALNADEAKTVVDTVMFSAWENRHRFKFTTWQKYHKLDPADVISANGETLRIDKRNEGVNGLIEIEAVRELPQIYTGQVGSGADSETPSQELTIGGPTQSYLLDVAPLRDSEANKYGFYWAADGYLDDWPGATLVLSEDGTYTPLRTTETASVSGYTDGALGNFRGGNIFDEINILRVYVTGTLESKTRLQVLNGANVAKVGDEIIQFRDATLVSTGIYDLSGLLRGRLNTEQAIDSHADGEPFVMLTTAGVRFIELQAADLNTTDVYIPVTHGETIESSGMQSFTYEGHNVRPFIPDHIGGGMPNLATGWTIKWMRRSRVDWAMNNGRDVAADESSYDFEVRIYAADLTTIKRTLTVTGATASGGYFSTTYSNANMTTDFGSVQRTIYVSVRQLGSMVDGDWSDIVTLTSVPNQIIATVLISGNGTDGSTAITDQYGHAVTVYGDAQVDTAFTDYFGSNDGVVLLDGTTDALSVDNAGVVPASNSQQFTVDTRVQCDTTPDGEALICVGFSVNNGTIVYALGFCDGSAGSAGGARPFFGYYDSGVGWRAAVSSDSVTSGQDYHIEGGYDGSKFYIFVNGILKGVSTSGINSVLTDQPVYFGRRWDTAGNRDYVAGKMYQMRIVMGEISHTSDFTPPAAPYTE